MGIVILNLVGQCGPFLGTIIFYEKDAPRYVRGQSVCAAFMIFTTILALTLRCLLVWENKRLDQKYGTRNEESAEGGPSGNDDSVAEENYGSRFRFVL
jgi:hypothetical protein